ncbi:MAG: hypothetical protein KKB02_05375, partial [Alphaproteobacteria bacterium]|nr:hypothetical protein [Alphaproteobacteria bacterium]
MIRLAIILMLLSAGCATAQTATVLSGDHPGFTRLTFPLGAGSDWTMQRTAQGYTLRFADPKSFDLSRVYRKIGRNRLAAIGADDGALSLIVPCRCAATAFRFRDRFLVIDIRDGLPDPASPFEQTAVSPSRRAAMALRASAGTALPGRMLLPLAPGTVPVPVAGPGLRPVKTVSVDLSKRPSVKSQDIGGLEKEVVDTLASAASQGLLTLAPDAAQAIAATTDDTVAPAPALAEPPHPVAGATSDLMVDAHGAVAPGSEATPGLLAHTSLDTLHTLLDTARGKTGDGTLCWPASYFAFPVMDDEPQAFGDVIGPLRTKVTDERDRPDAQAVTALARGYLAFGFGQEAMQVLDIDGVNDRERVAIRAVAKVIDDVPQTTPDLAAQIGCPGPVGLWAALASTETSSLKPAGADEIVQQFKLLPEILQSQLGPRLADLLRRTGLTELAETVLAPAQRMAVAPQSASQVAADLALDRGDVAQATGVLEAMAAEDPRITPDALVQLIDLQIAQDEVVEPETLSLLETMQFEYRNQPVVADILRVRTAALVHRGNLAGALGLLPQAEAALDPPAALALRDLAVAAVAAQGDDMLFLDLAFRPTGAAVSPAVQNKVASRLLDLGFPDRVLAVLAAPASGSIMAERRYLRASAAMDLDRPELAAATLSGVTTPRAAAILAGQRDMAGGPGGADAAWRSG